MDILSELTLVPRISKHYCALPVKVGAHGGRITNGCLAKIHVTVGPVCTQTNVVIISPGSTIKIDILHSWPNPHTSFLSFGARTIMAWKTKWKPLELLLSRKLVPQKQCHIPEVIAEMNATIRTKDAGCFFSPNPIRCPHLACAEGKGNLKNDNGLA